MKILRLLSLFFLGLAWQSCSTELDVNAPYRETKVLYGILDPTLPYQSFRIGRGFLSDGRSAKDIAKNSPDSSLFDPAIIEATLFEVKQAPSGRFDTTFRVLLYPDTLANKEMNGDFYGPEQLIYRTPDIQLDTVTRADLVHYLIRVRNKVSGNVSEAVTRIPGKNITIGEWAAIGPDDNGPFSLDFGSRKKTSIFVKNSYNTAVVQLLLNWKIRVVTDTGTVDQAWTLASGLENNIQENTKEIIFGAGSFWDFIGRELKERGNQRVISRRFISSEMVVFAGNKDYDNYRVVNGNYNAITQSQPVYSNLSNNALGIFCARNKRAFSVSLDQAVLDSLNVRFPDFKLLK